MISIRQQRPKGFFALRCLAVLIPSLALKKLVAVKRHATAKEAFSEPVDYKRFRN